jgi:hypothetical protein
VVVGLTLAQLVSLAMIAGGGAMIVRLGGLAPRPAAAT